MKNDYPSINSSNERAARTRKPWQIMKNANPLYDPTTHYRIVVQGQVDVEWLQGFDSTAEVSPDEIGHVDDITVLNIRTDQSGIVGLVRRLHGLGVTILQWHIVAADSKHY
jgi:hypothetical protein